MSRLRAEVGQAPLKRRVGAVARVAPQLAIGLLRLLVGRGQQGAVVLLRQRLPVQVVGARQARLARALAAAVLMDDDAAQRPGAAGDPDGVVDRIGQLAWLARGRIAHAVVRRLRRREDLVRRLLSVQARRSCDEKEAAQPAASRGGLGHRWSPPENGWRLRRQPEGSFSARLQYGMAVRLTACGPGDRERAIGAKPAQDLWPGGQ